MDGPEALTIWAQSRSKVDLLVTDIVMPNGMKGNVLAERLLAEKPDLKVLFSSGYSADFATESAPVNQRINFLQKPYKLDVLVKTVRDCLDR
jgi:DNA-binding NtrC family response regulator